MSWKVALGVAAAGVGGFVVGALAGYRAGETANEQKQFFHKKPAMDRLEARVREVEKRLRDDAQDTDRRLRELERRAGVRMGL